MNEKYVYKKEEYSIAIQWRPEAVEIYKTTTMVSENK